MEGLAEFSISNFLSYEVQVDRSSGWNQEVCKVLTFILRTAKIGKNAITDVIPPIFCMA